MADITASNVSEGADLELLAGEYISIKILNSDLTVKSTVIEKQCPSGKSLSGRVAYHGDLT